MINLKLLNTNFHRAFIISTFDGEDKTISKLLEEYTAALEEIAPKVNYFGDYHGDDIGEKNPQYEIWLGGESFNVNFAVPYEQNWAEPAIYDTFEEMIEKEEGNVEDDNDDYNHLKPQEEYDGREGLKVSRDKYGRWWVEHYDNDTNTENYKISVGAFSKAFSIIFQDLQQFGYAEEWQNWICDIDVIHTMIMDCIKKVTDGAMKPRYDYNREEFMKDAEIEAAGMEELWDENDERQPEFNFESLKMIWSNRL